MRPSFSRLILLNNTLYFFRKHFLAVILLGLIAALGRVSQLGGFGPISPSTNTILEVIIESARISLFLYVLGIANIRKGIHRIKHAFGRKSEFRNACSTAYKKLKQNWLTLVLNTVAFLITAWGINYLIDLTAYETCFYLKLKDNGILAEASSEWTILLFFKNLTVIPLTLIFDSLLLLWLINKLPVARQVQIV